VRLLPPAHSPASQAQTLRELEFPPLAGRAPRPWAAQVAALPLFALSCTRIAPIPFPQRPKPTLPISSLNDLLYFLRKPLRDLLSAM